MQLDDLPGGNPTDGTCVARVLRYSQKHPRISADLVPEMVRAQQSAANKALFQLLLKGLGGVWSVLDKNLRHGNSAIDVYRYFVSLKPCNPHGELKDLRDQVLDAGHPHTRMLLEVKRDMRRKGRLVLLVLQGFRAPSWWRIGSTDSPVVATAGLRALIFRRDKLARRRENAISIRL